MKPYVLRINSSLHRSCLFLYMIITEEEDDSWPCLGCHNETISLKTTARTGVWGGMTRVSYTHTHTHTYIHTHLDTHTHLYLSTHTHLHTRTQIDTFMHTPTHTHKHTYIYTRKQIYIYIYINL